MYASDRHTPQLRQSHHHQLDHGEKLDRFTKGRRCIAEGCTTLLSRYNPSETCGAHAGWADRRERHYG